MKTMNPLTDAEVDAILEKVRRDNGTCDTKEFERVNGMSDELRKNLESESGFQDYLDAVAPISE